MRKSINKSKKAKQSDTFVYDILCGAVAFTNAQWGGLCVTTLFWIFGLVGMMFRSRKERALVEEHLLRICNIKS